MKFSVSIILAITIVSSYNAVGLLNLLGPKDWKISEIGKMNFTEIAEKFGYPAEEKDVLTEDGYILKMYHIPGNTTRAVLLVHGNTPTGDCWIMRGETSLALTLAKKGYDVWAINLRGSRYSRRHRFLNPDTQPAQFFNFTFYEQGKYDMPAAVDMVLRATGQQQVLAIGHSVGTTQLYVMGAERPEYNDKIKLAISLAPVCFIDKVRGSTASAASYGPITLGLLELFNIYEVAKHEEFEPLLKANCLQPFGYDVCFQQYFFKLVGYDEKGMEPEFLPTLVGHYPGGTTTKLLKHLNQVMMKKNFVKFDYGRTENLAVYNSTEPPPFDLSKVTMKSALFVGKEDHLATVQDSRRLKAALPNVVHYEVLPYDRFNHIDFIWGRYMTDNFYPYLLPVIEKYI